MRLAVFLLLGTFRPWLAQSDRSREERSATTRRRSRPRASGSTTTCPRRSPRRRTTGKPILVVLRCIPCEECVKLDDDLVDNDPASGRCSRSSSASASSPPTASTCRCSSSTTTSRSPCSCSTPTAPSTAGSAPARTAPNWVGDVSLDGLAKALQGRSTCTRTTRRTRTSSPASAARPRSSPRRRSSRRSRTSTASKLDYEGNVVQSCIHCHQIGDAQREFYWQQGKPIRRSVLFPYPHPKSSG